MYRWTTQDRSVKDCVTPSWVITLAQGEQSRYVTAKVVTTQKEAVEILVDFYIDKS